MNEPQPVTPDTDVQPERRLLTIIMPALNEEANLPRAYDEVTAVMGGLPYDYEVLVIDNASADGTETVANEICAHDSRWRYVRFSRNFQLEASLAAGLRYARGEAALVLFSDLQDPPAMIPDFLKKWEEGHDVVYGVIRRRGGDPVWKAWSARLFYRIMNAVADVEITPNATDFRLLSRRAIDALNQFEERHRYHRGFAHWIGFKRCALSYDRLPRTAGRSKLALFGLVNFAIEAITSFSMKPLRVFSILGVLALLGTLVLGLLYLGSQVFSYSVPGLTPISLLLLANLTVLLLGFGTLGEYVGRMYVETKRRPLYLVDREVNVSRKSPLSRNQETRSQTGNHQPAARVGGLSSLHEKWSVEPKAARPKPR